MSIPDSNIKNSDFNTAVVSSSKERIEPCFERLSSDEDLKHKQSDQGNPTAANIFDLSKARHRKLEKTRGELENNLKELIRSGKATSINLYRVERAVMGLVSAFTTEELLAEFAHRLAPNMGVDYVSLCLESEAGRLTTLKVPGIYWLTLGSLDVAMHGERIILSSAGGDYARVFGKESQNINSCALVRLELPDIQTRGLLAFGTRIHNHFNPGQGSDFIHFLGQMSEKLLTRAFLGNSISVQT